MLSLSSEDSKDNVEESDVAAIGEKKPIRAGEINSVLLDVIVEIVADEDLSNLKGDVRQTRPN